MPACSARRVDLDVVALGRLERHVDADLARELARPGAGGEHDRAGVERAVGGVEPGDPPVRPPQAQDLDAGADLGAVLARAVQQRVDERAGSQCASSGCRTAPGDGGGERRLELARLRGAEHAGRAAALVDAEDAAAGERGQAERRAARAARGCARRARAARGRGAERAGQRRGAEAREPRHEREPRAQAERAVAARPSSAGRRGSRPGWPAPRRGSGRSGRRCRRSSRRASSLRSSDGHARAAARELVRGARADRSRPDHDDVRSVVLDNTGVLYTLRSMVDISATRRRDDEAHPAVAVAARSLAARRLRRLASAGAANGLDTIEPGKLRVAAASYMPYTAVKGEQARRPRRRDHHRRRRPARARGRGRADGLQRHARRRPVAPRRHHGRRRRLDRGAPGAGPVHRPAVLLAAGDGRALGQDATRPSTTSRASGSARSRATSGSTRSRPSPAPSSAPTRTRSASSTTSAPAGSTSASSTRC